MRRPAGRPGPVGRPPPLSLPPHGGGRIIELAQRLIGKARDRGGRIGGRHARPGSERACGPQPLRLDGCVRRQHQRPGPEPPEQFHAEQRLARAGRGDDVRLLLPAFPARLERLQRELLIATPGAAEGQRAERGSESAVVIEAG